jgi:hypothetical protein
MSYATIDIYHDEISAALSHGDHARLCEIARSFCERCHYWKPWRITNVTSDLCPLDGLQVRVAIEIGHDDPSSAEVCIGYARGKRRLTVNGKSISCNSSADVIHELEVPCSFFDGIYFAIEGIERIARGEMKEQIAKWDHEAKASRLAVEREWANIEHAHKLMAQKTRAAEEAEGRLSRAIERRRLVGNRTTWSLCPVDFTSRIIDAQSLVALYDPEFISLAEAKLRLSGKSGVYFGWRVADGKCVYVGKSENLGNRLHPRREELVDCKITYIEMPPEEIHTWELFFIWLHRPERNKEVRESVASIEKRSKQNRGGGMEVA